MMARRKRLYKKTELVDPHYESKLVASLISRVMLSGKRSLAERIVYGAINRANEGSEAIDPLQILQRAIDNAQPKVEVKSRRVGGATYQVPMEIEDDRAKALAMRWLIQCARKRKGSSMEAALANEIKDAANNQGAVVRKRDDMHKMAQANRAFAHFRF